MVEKSSDVSSTGETLGSILARLRRDAGLTGQELGRRVNMSQAKISRLENNVGHPSTADIRHVAESLQAPPDLIERLVELTERLRRQPAGPASLGDTEVVNLQRELEALEAATRVYRVFQPAVIIGLAQTDAYMRAIFETSPSGHSRRVAEAVSIRVRRQEALWDPDREFHFLMMESVLANRVCEPQYMSAQLLRLREVAAMPNVSLRVVPLDASLDVPPYHGFELLDDRVVTVDLYHSVLRSDRRSDIELYQSVFDRLESSSTEDIDPILEKYFDRYRDLARPSPRQRAATE
ncbi:helix-turn-helix domain-containing protein [Actinoplanes sp. CA-030573]|uniref:helix-turn-helix domain-containing protein n=1 Tax=Actinoplanes sp. CA-030573 TaxID=3239898 RepID=UPI003D90B086